LFARVGKRERTYYFTLAYYREAKNMQMRGNIERRRRE
jgi:hypothetical protein